MVTTVVGTVTKSVVGTVTSSVSFTTLTSVVVTTVKSVVITVVRDISCTVLTTVMSSVVVTIMNTVVGRVTVCQWCHGQSKSLRLAELHPVIFDGFDTKTWDFPPSCVDWSFDSIASPDPELMEARLFVFAVL